MDTWPSGIDAITLFVEDLEASKDFYRQVFDLPVMFEDASSAVFNFRNTIINLLTTSEVADLIGPATMATRDAGSRFVFTLEADDVDEKTTELVGRGAELVNGPIDRPWGVRTASFRDPDGYIWEIARKISP